MAFKLTKNEATTRDDFVARFEMASAELDQVRETTNEAIEALLGPLNEKITAYNVILAEAKEYAEEIAARFQTEFDDKSEKWQESEKGVAVSEMIESWTNLDFEEVDDVAIDQIEDFDFEHRDILDAVPVEAES